MGRLGSCRKACVVSALIVVGVILALCQLAVHLESRSVGQTRRQRRALGRTWERNRLFWSIRDLEKEVLGIDWCSAPTE